MILTYLHKIFNQDKGCLKIFKYKITVTTIWNYVKNDEK